MGIRPFNGMLMWDLLDYFEPATGHADDGSHLQHPASPAGRWWRVF